MNILGTKMRATSLIGSYRAIFCRSPITSYNVNAAYRTRLASSVAGSNVNNSDKAADVASSATTASTTTTTTSDAMATTASTANLQFNWEVADEPSFQIIHSVITGSIVPVAQLNWLQLAIFPYTYAVMYYMDFMMNYMPWWGAIVATTATCKIVFFPLLIKQQRIGIKSHNILPETQKLQANVNDAMVRGDAYNAALYRTKLKLIYDQHGLSIGQRLWPALVQAPMFMSIFFLLRKLTSEPVESLATGGAFWFTNLTVPDPYFILPFITCGSLFALLELGLGVEGASGGPVSTMRPIGRWLMRGMPVVLFALIHNFPSATLLFWTTNNLFSLVSALILRQPLIMRTFNIPQRIKHDAASLPLTNQSLSSQLKAAKEMGQASRTTHDIRRLDDIAFKKAGVGPVKKTYKNLPPQEKG